MVGRQIEQGNAIVVVQPYRRMIGGCRLVLCPVAAQTDLFPAARDAAAVIDVAVFLFCHEYALFHGEYYICFAKGRQSFPIAFLPEIYYSGIYM